MILEKVPKITVIIPVYQAEAYLSPCIESVLLQTYHNFEILLIDDGSTDNSGLICDKYSEKYPAITVFHRKNQGVSKTRNFGILQASGEYILFVDADDMIQPTYIEELYNTISHDRTDCISMCGFQLLQDDVLTEKAETLSAFEADRDSLHEQYLAPIITGKIQGTCWRVLFPKKLLLDNNIFFSSCKIAEDLLFLIEVISHCRSIQICEQPLYIYRQLPQSSSHRSYITNYLPDRLIYMNKLQLILKDAQLEQEQRQWLLSFSFQFFRMLLYMNATSAPNFQREIAQIDLSPFGTQKVSKKLQHQFYSQIRQKHKVLNFLVVHRLYFLIRLIRSQKRHSL